MEKLNGVPNYIKVRSFLYAFKHLGSQADHGNSSTVDTEEFNKTIFSDLPFVALR